MTCLIRQITAMGNLTLPPPWGGWILGPKVRSRSFPEGGGSGVFEHQLPSVMEQGAHPAEVNLPALPACTAHRGTKMSPKKEILRQRCRCCQLEVGLLCTPMVRTGARH